MYAACFGRSVKKKRLPLRNGPESHMFLQISNFSSLLKLNFSFWWGWGVVVDLIGLKLERNSHKNGDFIKLTCCEQD